MNPFPVTITLHPNEEATLPIADARRALDTLLNGTGEGNDFLGWMRLPNETPEELLQQIEAAKRSLATKCRHIVCVGIGGSYLGARAAIEALCNPFHQETEILFAGNHLEQDYLAQLLHYLKGREWGIVNISKSGTTTEPAVAFRLLRKQLEAEKGKAEANRRIVAITDANKGALRTLAGEEGWTRFVIPDDVGGRFSVLTPVGLLPMALAGIDIRQVLRGAADMRAALFADQSAANPALRYAAARQMLYRNGKKCELLASFTPRLRYFAEWWKQLFAESEGKQHRSLLPASVIFTTDLHSLGQWIQDGERIVFETFLSVKQPEEPLEIPSDDADSDGLNYLAGRSVHGVNLKAEEATINAHRSGGVPCLELAVERLDAYHLGALFFFFETAVSVSGYMLGINPFNQPGVETYKHEMFRLLEKPGY